MLRARDAPLWGVLHAMVHVVWAGGARDCVQCVCRMGAVCELRALLHQHVCHNRGAHAMVLVMTSFLVFAHAHHHTIAVTITTLVLLNKTPSLNHPFFHADESLSATVVTALRWPLYTRTTSPLTSSQSRALASEDAVTR